ncbi:MAG: ChpI protein [Rectinemataceae bacterium]
MKTAISLPDALYADAEKTASSMGIPRSQLFAKALEEFIHHHKRERITERLNEVYDGADNSDFARISAVSLDSVRELTKDDAW